MLAFEKEVVNVLFVQVEHAQRRAPFSERKEKKRKRTEETATAATDDDHPAEAAVPSPARAVTAGADAAAPGSVKAVKQRLPKRPKTAGSVNEKQRLVRTVALGNLSAANRDQAIAYAQCVTEVCLRCLGRTSAALANLVLTNHVLDSEVNILQHCDSTAIYCQEVDSLCAGGGSGDSLALRHRGTHALPGRLRWTCSILGLQHGVLQ